jgi:N-acetylglucosamine-6-phosphate deacetylase
VLSLVADPVVALEHGFSRTPSTPCPGSGTALTWIPARALGLDDRLGRLAPGYAADAVLLNGALEVSAVWGAGRRLA